MESSGPSLTLWALKSVSGSAGSSDLMLTERAWICGWSLGLDCGKSSSTNPFVADQRFELAITGMKDKCNSELSDMTADTSLLLIGCSQWSPTIITYWQPGPPSESSGDDVAMFATSS